MARIRTIKPEFFKNEVLAELHPLTRILFQGLWCCADSKGRLEDRPRRIKADVLPYDDHDIDIALDELAGLGFIIRYTAEDVKAIQITNFSKHQRITGKETEYDSHIPPPDTSGETTGKQLGNKSETTGKQLGNKSETPVVQERKGKERNIKPPTPFQGDVCNSETIEAIDPNFDPRVSELWEGIEKVCAEVQPEREKPRLTPYRRRYASQCLGMHSVSDLTSAWLWALSSGSERAKAIREKWKGVDTFLSPERVTGYVELAKADSFGRSPPTLHPWEVEQMRQDKLDRERDALLAKETPESREQSRKLIQAEIARRTGAAVG